MYIYNDIINNNISNFSWDSFILSIVILLNYHCSSPHLSDNLWDRIVELHVPLQIAITFLISILFSTSSLSYVCQIRSVFQVNCRYFFFTFLHFIHIFNETINYTIKKAVSFSKN